MRGYVYLASSYTADPEGKQKAYERVRAVAVRFAAAGVPFFSPIVHTHNLENTSRPLPAAVLASDEWLALDEPLLRGASTMVVLMSDGVTTSRGVAREVEIADSAQIPVRFYNADKLTVSEIQRLAWTMWNRKERDQLLEEGSHYRITPEDLANCIPPAPKDERCEQAYNQCQGGVGSMRHFDTGATRNALGDKPDYEGFLSPFVLRAYGEYMHRNRKMEDGTLRASDNWQLGIHQSDYLSSLVRHVIDLWGMCRDPEYDNFDKRRDAALAVMFNAMGWVFEDLREETEANSD